MTALPPFDRARFAIPDLPDADALLPYLRRIDENRWYSNFGPLVQEFEARFSAAMAAAHRAARARPFVTMASGYYALSLGLRLLSVGPKSRVLVPAVTFPACPLAPQNLGAEAVLADVDPESWTLTPAIARAVIARHKIDAVMPVCVYGFPLDAQAWDSFEKETGVPVLIDAAAAIEVQRYPARGIVAHSLHALKPFGIGEGGVLALPNEALARRARQATNFGMKDRRTFAGGENAKMSEYHAAVALAQMDRWETVKRRRKDVLDLYLAALAPLGAAARAHPMLAQTIPSAMMIRLEGRKGQATAKALCARGVAAHRLYLPPLYDHPHFARLRRIDARGKAAGRLDGAESMNASVIGLPFHPFMAEEDVQKTVDALASLL